VERPLSIGMIGLRGIPATYGGVEAAVEGLSAELVRRGHSVTVYGRSAYCEPELTEYRGVKLRPLPQINTKHLEAVSHTLVASAVAVAQGMHDVLHLHATGPAMFSVIPRLARTACVATVQGLDWRREKWGPLASRVLRLGAFAAATVPHETIVVSRSLERELREQYSSCDPTYIPNGIDQSKLRGGRPVADLAPGNFILFLGRLVPEKGVHTLIEAYGRLDTAAPLVIAGPDSHSSDYVGELRELASRDRRVQMIGPRYGEEKTWLLQNASMFVQPSTVEGLPIALLEAIACGQFTIVSDIPENTEVVSRDGHRHGLVFRTGDVDDLTTQLSQALGNPHRQEEGVECRRDVLGEYTWPRVAADTERVYQRALARSS
jgi:glycosyltransferase involved in cell wall biosynthesis